MARVACLGLVLAQASGAAGQVLCGPVILAGHDADDHGFAAVYAGLFNSILASVTNGKSGILALGPDPALKAGQWITTVASLMTVPQAVTFVNDAALSTVSFDDYAILHVPSDNLDTAGGITQAESDLLAARRADFGTFVTDGGGLFGLTQGQLTGGWGYIVDVALLDFVTIPPSGILPSGSAFDNVLPTAAGSALGITVDNVDGCCFHNIFTSFPPFLQSLAVADEPLDPPFNGQSVFIGGVRTCINTVVLSVAYDWVRAERRADGTAAIRFETLSEEGTEAFRVWRGEPGDASSLRPLRGVLGAHGPGLAYEFIDAEPPAEAVDYVVEEMTGSGAGDRSAPFTLPAVGSDPGPAGGRARRPGGLRTAPSP